MLVVGSTATGYLAIVNMGGRRYCKMANFGEQLDLASLLGKNLVFRYYSGSNIVSNWGL